MFEDAGVRATLRPYEIMATGPTAGVIEIKDRHNGNILLTADGHLVHIDWGFALGLSPGGNFGFESAPFKLTQEFVDVMGGSNSIAFQRYRELCVKAFLEARKNRHKIITLVEMMASFCSELPCFSGNPDAVARELEARFQPDLSVSECVKFVNDLVDKSMGNWRTRWYDRYQRHFVGIL
ncbi:unnamed protein product [Choristocarpus tenellus]